MSSRSARDALLDRVLDYFARRGVGDTSLRALAAGVGTSHRMLIYHFGSREGLLAAIVERLWVEQHAQLEKLLAAEDPFEAAWHFWQQLADDRSFAPLFFELSAAAMQGHDWAIDLRGWVQTWTDRLIQFFTDVGHPPARADILGRTAMALVRGVLFELALTGDRAGADRTIANFLDTSHPPG